jgi:hypothetical protein
MPRAICAAKRIGYAGPAAKQGGKTMRPTIILALCGAAATGCTFSGDLSPTDPVLQAAYVETLRTVVPRVVGLELGRTRDGFALAAFGSTDERGWSSAQLRPRDPLVAPDGFMEFDLTGVPPQGAAPIAGPAPIRADRALAEALVGQTRGARVFAVEGSMEGLF